MRKQLNTHAPAHLTRIPDLYTLLAAGLLSGSQDRAAGVQRNDRQPGQGHRQAAPPSHLVHQALPFDAAHALKLW